MLSMSKTIKEFQDEMAQCYDIKDWDTLKRMHVMQPMIEPIMYKVAELYGAQFKDRIDELEERIDDLRNDLLERGERYE